MNSKRRLSLAGSAHKLGLDSVNKIIKLDKNKQKKDTINGRQSRVALAELIKNATSTQRSQPPDFKTFLTQEENVRAFREFLQTQYCQENLDFYLACERYRNLDTNGKGGELARFIARQIFNDHLSENARQPVNVNNACVQIIADNLTNPTSDLFDDAQTEIFELMKTDCYPRFCKTWQLDRNLAHKILHQDSQCNQSSSMASFSEQNTEFSSISTLASTTKSLTVPARRASLRLADRSKNISSSSSSSNECPPECPYFRVGRLPCTGHRKAPTRDRSCTQQLEFNDRVPLHRMVDLRQIHRPPNTCVLDDGLPPALLSSPPPPLPPKPENIDLDQIRNKRLRPYVGKVFNV